MPHYQYDNSPYPIRSGLPVAYQKYWRALARPGTWFTGAERVAIAGEVRNALSCPFPIRHPRVEPIVEDTARPGHSLLEAGAAYQDSDVSSGEHRVRGDGSFLHG